MKRPPSPLNFVRSFECAARHLSFTRAAEELGYTQAAISTHVRTLENYIGRALFIRNARSLQLTEIGEAFLPTLRQALGQIDAAAEAIVTTSRDRSVVLACPMSLAENWLPGILADFRKAHADIEVAVHGTVWDTEADSIADVVISIDREDEVPAGAHLLWPETLTLLCAPHMAADVTSPEALMGLARISVSGRQEYWSIMGAALGLPDMKAGHTLRANSSNISLEMAAHGLGATVSLTSLSVIYVQRGLLVEPFDVRPRSPWSYHVCQRDSGKRAAANQLIGFMRERATA